MSTGVILPNPGELSGSQPKALDERSLGGVAVSGSPEGVMPKPNSDGPTGYDRFLVEGATPDYPPATYVLPSEIAGEDPHDTFNTRGLPWLREIFPTYYADQQERVRLASLRDPEIVVELTPEEAFESLALQLRIILDAGDEAARDGDEVLMTFDNDKVASRKPDATLHLGSLATHDEEWDSLSDAEQRSAYHKMITQDVEATVISPAVIVGVNVLKEKYGNKIHFGMVTSNVQEYLDLLYVRLNALTGDAFDPNYMIGYDDGRFASDMKQERLMTRGDNEADPSASPTLQDVFSRDISWVYAGAERYIDFNDPDAKSVSAQDLKPGILLRLKDEDPYRRLSVVHIDDMPSAMRSNVPGARYIELPHAAWFKLIENGLF